MGIAHKSMGVVTDGHGLGVDTTWNENSTLKGQSHEMDREIFLLFPRKGFSS